ncbi:DEAD/DEAH box helicase [Methylobacterium platani]|nr:DEAD/DEAH box helicase [Methylobacterium platani]
MAIRLRAALDTAGITVAAEERRMLGRTRTVPLAEGSRVPEIRSALRVLNGLVAEDRAQREGEVIRLSHAEAAALPPDVLKGIGLPELARVSLDLAFEDRVDSEKGWLRLRWRNERQAEIRPERVGLVLRAQGLEGRLSPALLALVEAAEGYNASRGQPLEARVAAWMPVQQALRDALGPEVGADAYTRNLTFYQAGAFALDVREAPHGVDFTPVLMAREQAASREDDAPDPIVEEGEADPLLPPEDHRTFLSKALNSPTRDAYVVGPNRFVLIDPHLKPLLEVVRAKRRASPEVRRAFIRNPRAALADGLGDTIEDGRTSLFVETAHYSDRVIALGIWERPKLPWLTKRAHTWLPESGWTDARGEAVAAPDLSEPERQDLAVAIAQARDAGAAEVTIKGVVVPLAAAEAFLHASGVPEPERAPSGEETHPETEDAQEDQREDPPPDDQHVLLIKTNYEDIEYEQTLQPRKALIAPAPPADRMGASRFKEHQEKGFGWLVAGWRAGWPGMLLADDMGLGKTFQALAFMAWIRSNQEEAKRTRDRAVERGPILVVAPTALLKNWEQECSRHLSPIGLGERVDAYGAALRHLKRPPDQRTDPGETLDVGRLRAADWILTTYETLTDHEQAFARIRYALVLFDEMQKVKAPDTLNTKAAKALNADFVLGLTGTPIENRLEDLWCIMDRLTPGYLGDLKGFSGVYGEEDPDRLRDLKRKLDEPVGPAPAIMLRRMKSDVLEGLPTKTEERYEVPMPRAQAEAYGRIVMAAHQADGTRKPGDMLRIIHELRGVSLHPDDPESVRLGDARAFEAYAARSARLHQSVEILRKIRAKGEKAILFIESLAMQRAVAAGLTELFDLPAPPGIINGGTPGEQRQRIVDAFQASPPGFGLLVLSPKAAGIGLTITAANHVIHLSRWWNPAVEDQCNDRAYRIGQVRPVTIHLPMAIFPDHRDSSFDLTLDGLLRNKRQLSREMLAAPVSARDTQAIFEQTIGA